MRPSEVPDELIHDQDLAALMARVAAGDVDALAAFYDGTSARVYGLVLRMVGDTALAEEVLLEVFTAVWRQASAYQRHSCPPLLWVLMIARGLALDKRQLQSRPEPVVEQQGQAKSSVSFAGVAGDASAVAPQEAILAALKALPPELQFRPAAGEAVRQNKELTKLPRRPQPKEKSHVRC